MQIPILNGIYTDENSDFRTSYPRNLVPVPKPQGISKGYLRPAQGAIKTGEGPGNSRGGINWNGACYRVLGSKLVLHGEDGLTTTIDDVGDGGLQVSMDYSFDYLGVVSDEKFYLYDGSTVTQVTDPDLGSVIDHIWVDGYFMLTDGEFLIVTELTDPFSVNPLKYGSSEADPDPVKAVLKIRNEPYALNRYTIEVFDNIGGSGFPFQRVDGAQVQRGTIGTHTCCVMYDAVAFVGGGRGESIAVWLAASGQSTKLSTREIDQVLAGYSEDALSKATVESRIYQGHQHLHINLPDQTLVYDAAASQVLGQPVWFTLSSGLDLSRYRIKDFVWCYGEWLVGDPVTGYVGYMTSTLASHWGDLVGWEVETSIVYNEGNGAIFHEVELVTLSGRSNLGDDSTVWSSYSLDGREFSNPRGVKAGKQGQRAKRLVWINQGAMQHWRTQRFTGTSDAMLSIARLEARVEPLVV